MTGTEGNETATGAARARGASLNRRIRSSGGKVIRRLGLLPRGLADGLGQDDELLGKRLGAEVIVYFPGTADTLQHLEPWYAALRALHQLHPTVVVLQDSRAAARVREDSGLEALTIAYYGTMDDLLGRSDVRMVVYVDHSAWNFSMLRFTSLVHTALIRGRNRGFAQLTNQLKAYDFLFVEDSGVVLEIESRIGVFPPTNRCVVVGEPALAAEHVELGATGTATSGLERFLDACDEALAARDVEWARLQANGAVGP